MSLHDRRYYYNYPPLVRDTSEWIRSYNQWQPNKERLLRFLHNTPRHLDR